MELPPVVDTLLKHIGAVVIAVLVLAAVVFHVVQQHAWEKQRVDLQNQLASKDKTIEEQKGLYEKLALQESNVENVLNSKDKQIQELEAQLKSTGQQLETATSTSVYWKKAYEGVTEVSEKETPPEGSNKSPRIEVDFKRDFGYIGVHGWCKTNPAEGWVFVENLRPLKLTVALSQDKSKAWHSYVTSSEENVAADITVSAVDPYILQPKWYEKLAVRGDFGVGTTDSGTGLLLGLGATMEIGRFDVGPAVWVGISNRVDRYLGAMVGFHPFQRQ